MKISVPQLRKLEEICLTSDQKDSSPNSHYIKLYPISECLRPLISEILPLADRAGNASQKDKGGRGNA
jgi:hypothetical protein